MELHFLMLKAANVYEKVFMKLAEDDLSYKWDLSKENDGFGCPEDVDWENAKKMEEFLEHFYDLTNRVSSTLHVTSNTFFHEIVEVHLLIQSWFASEDPLQKAMGKRMKDKFDKYWGLWHTNDKENMNEREKGKGKGKEKENINLLIFVAAVVDPRYKLSLYTNAVIEEIFGQEKGQLVWTAVITCINDLFVEYTKLYATNEVTEEVDDSRTSKGGRGGMLKEVIAKKLKMTTGANSNAKSELDKYLAEDTEDQEMKFDILAWWRSNACRFPILARLARDVLAIPITSVALESAFSTSGRILDDFRTSLTPFMLEALVCAQDWLRRGGTPIDIQESMEELVVIEKGKIFPHFRVLTLFFSNHVTVFLQVVFLILLLLHMFLLHCSFHLIQSSLKSLVAYILQKEKVQQLPKLEACPSPTPTPTQGHLLKGTSITIHYIIRFHLYFVTCILNQ